MNKLLLNALLFQLGWFLCVFAARQPWLLLGVPLLLAIHLRWVAGWHAEGRLLVSVLLSGAALDSTLLQMGVLDFAGDSLLLPLWLAARGCCSAPRSIIAWPGAHGPGGVPACSAHAAGRCPTTLARNWPVSGCRWACGPAC